MPKRKTRKSLTKRFKVTRTGKVLRRAVGQDHNLQKQTSKKRRSLKKWVELSPEESKRVKRILAR
jgi:large subunit ribosomal protein L35